MYRKIIGFLEFSVLNCVEALGVERINRRKFFKHD